MNEPYVPNHEDYILFPPLRTGSLIPITVYVGNLGDGNPILKIVGQDVGENFPVLYTENSTPLSEVATSLLVNGMPLLLRPGQDAVMLRLDFPVKDHVAYVEFVLAPDAHLLMAAYTVDGYEKFEIR